MPVSSAPPRSGLLVDGGERARDFAREMQSDNEELRESNRQLIAALEEIQSLNVTLQSVNESLHTTNVELRSELDRLRSRASELDHMLNAIGVAVVLLGEGLLVRDYNATACRFFALKKPDIGRSISRVRHEFVQTSLPDLCREAQGSGEPLERIATGSGGGLVSLRIREIDLGASESGLLLTVTEITDIGPEPPLEPPSRIV
jgi:nitrogen fixation/metabolism regulation signal transduction histidine kinase